ncbi:hypothetical protein ACFQ60_47930 [Streptomyces zhihengii]
MLYKLDLLHQSTLQLRGKRPFPSATELIVRAMTAVEKLIEKEQSAHPLNRSIDINLPASIHDKDEATRPSARARPAV